MKPKRSRLERPPRDGLPVLMRQTRKDIKMNNANIMKILKAHFVPCYEAGGHVFADSMLSGTEEFEKVEDVTGWSKKSLLA